MYLIIRGYLTFVVVVAVSNEPKTYATLLKSGSNNSNYTVSQSNYASQPPKSLSPVSIFVFCFIYFYCLNGLILFLEKQFLKKISLLNFHYQWTPLMIYDYDINFYVLF